MPDGFEYLWAIFWELRRGVSAGFSGASVTWRDLADYQAVTGIRLGAFDIEAVMAMDGALNAALAEERDASGNHNHSA